MKKYQDPLAFIAIAISIIGLFFTDIRAALGPAIALAIIIVISVLIIVFQNINKLNRKLHWNIQELEKNGIFGRDECIKRIIAWHNGDRNNKWALICGDAGIGKTAIALALKKILYPKNRVILVSKNNDIPKFEDLLPNSLIIFDYVLEKYENISDFIRHLVDLSVKHISVILLERDSVQSLIRLFKEPSLVFNLNDDSERLSEDTISKIIHYKVQSFSSDKDSIRQEITIDEAKKYAKEIINKLGSKPIYATLIAEIYCKSSKGDFDIEEMTTIDALFKKYWEISLSLKKFPDIVNSHRARNTIEELQKQIKLVLLFVTITSICIKIQEVYPSNTISFETSISLEPDLEIYIRNSFPKETIGIDTLKLLYFSSYKITDNILCIYPVSFDLFSAWLFYDSIKRNREKTIEWLNLIASKHYDQIKIFSLRTAEIFSSEVFDSIDAIDPHEFKNRLRWKKLLEAEFEYLRNSTDKEAIKKVITKEIDSIKHMDEDEMNNIINHIIDVIENYLQQNDDLDQDGFLSGLREKLAPNKHVMK